MKRSRALRPALALLPVLLFAACAPAGVPAAIEVTPAGRTLNVDYVPDFARKPYAPFSRDDVMAIALREWRLWGQNVDDLPPEGRPPPPPELKPERDPGLWQRVGEYWWLGMNPDSNAHSWTGKHDAFGYEFGYDHDFEYPWSAAFISYVMRIAGAGARFPYSESHSAYINAGRRVSLGSGQGWVVSAERTDAYAPQPGDIICHGRAQNQNMRYAMLPRANGFSSHCQIVVRISPGMLDTIGGNVDDSVTMIHVPVDSAGLLAAQGERVFDTRYPWFVVLRVLYDAPAPTPVPVASR